MKKSTLKAIVSVLLAACTGFMLSSCEKPQENEEQQETVSVNGVTLDITECTVYCGKTKQLTATVTPENADNRKVFWSSSDYRTASVSQDGTVTGNAAGTATITVTTQDGEFTAECTVTVTDKSVPVTGVSLNTTSLTLHQGENATLQAEVTPSRATDKSVRWESSNSNVATVFDNGTVYGAGIGEATVTVVTNDGNFTAECTITVLPEREKLPEYIDEYGINQGMGIRIGNNIWAPVNCGFRAPQGDDKGYPYGKLYQWGRKDGHGYDDKDADVPEISKEAITSPDEAEAGKFYTAWDETVAPDGTWGGEDGKTKTKYDPCPEGWRVPTIEELDQLKGDATDLEAGSTWRRGDLDDTPLKLYGRWFGKNHLTATATNPQDCLFLPAPGRRGSWGYVNNREYEGRYWASGNSTIYKQNADALYYFEAIYFYLDSEQRGTGLPVRCIKDDTSNN